MERKPYKIYRIFLLLLILPVCGSLLIGCSRSAPTAPVPSTAATETIPFDGIPLNPDAESLTVTDPDMEELTRMLPQLPGLRTLSLEGVLPPTETLLGLQTRFPGIHIVCQVTLGSKTVSSDDEILDLSDTAITFEELSRTLPLFFRLRELDLTGTNLTDEEKLALAETLKGVFLRCSLPLAGQYFSTDVQTMDLSHTPVTLEELERVMPRFQKLQKLDLSFCGISDEDLEVLNQKYPETDIVWTVTIGEVTLRTDAIYFYPAEDNYYPTNEQMQKLRYCHDLIAIDIGHTRATDCEFLYFTPKVKYLILADTGITDITPVGSLPDLLYLELFNLRLTDYSPLLNCRKLQDLNLGTTHADPEPISQMTWLHNLQWHRADQNPDTKEAVLKLPEQLPDTHVELYPVKKARNIGGPWRYIPNYYVFRDIIGADYFNQDQIRDYWGQRDGDRILAAAGNASGTLAQIVRERIDSGQPIIGIQNSGSEKAEILYETLLHAQS